MYNYIRMYRIANVLRNDGTSMKLQVMYIISYNCEPIVDIYSARCASFNLWPLKLTWFNFNPSMDK